MAYKIIANIEQLGFDIKDVRILLASDPHPEESGALAELQTASGAELWASRDNAEVIARGGKGDPDAAYTPYKVMTWAGILDYPAPQVDHQFDDGETIRVGPLALTAHITPGHARGCTTWAASKWTAAGSTRRRSTIARRSRSAATSSGGAAPKSRAAWPRSPRC